MLMGDESTLTEPLPGQPASEDSAATEGAAASRRFSTTETEGPGRRLVVSPARPLRLVRRGIDVSCTRPGEHRSPENDAERLTKAVPHTMRLETDELRC